MLKLLKKFFLLSVITALMMIPVTSVNAVTICPPHNYTTRQTMTIPLFTKYSHSFFMDTQMVKQYIKIAM